MIDEEGGTSEVVHVDVTVEQSCEKAVTEVVRLFGAIHILVNIGITGFLVYFIVAEDANNVLSRSWRRYG